MRLGLSMKIGRGRRGCELVTRKVRGWECGSGNLTLKGIDTGNCKARDDGFGFGFAKLL